MTPRSATSPPTIRNWRSKGRARQALWPGSRTPIEQKQRGTRKKLAGLEMADRGIARDGYPVWTDGRVVGRVTSGSYAPYLKKNIGLAYVPPEYAETGREIQVEIRGSRVAARLAPLPFYKRAKA